MRNPIYRLDWKRGHKVRSKQRKRTKEFRAVTETRLLKVWETRSGWVGKISSRAGWQYKIIYGMVPSEVPHYEPKTIAPCGDSRSARLALEVILALEEKL